MKIMGTYLCHKAYGASLSFVKSYYYESAEKGEV